jgi:hypothetical protein
MCLPSRRIVFDLRRFVIFMLDRASGVAERGVR